MHYFTPDWSKLSTQACGLRLTVKSSPSFYLFRDYDHVCIVLEKDSDLTGSGLVVGLRTQALKCLPVLVYLRH